MAFTLANPKVVLQGKDEATRVFTAAMKRADSVAKSFGKIGATLTKGITLPAVAGAGAAVKMAMDFNKSMASVASLMPGQQERVLQMKKQIQDLAIESGQDVLELSGTLKELISSLGEAGDPVKKMEAVTKAAAATTSTSSDTLKLMTSVLKAYGDTSEEAFAKVSDIAVLAERVGDAPFVDMANNIGKVAAKSSTLGVSFEEMFGVLSAYGNTLGSVADVSTQFSAILNGFIKPTKDLAKIAKKYGHESAVAMIQNRGFAGSMQVLREETKGSVPAIGKLFGSSKAMNQLIPMLTDNFDVYVETIGELTNASGSVDEALREQREGLNKTGFRLEQMKQRLVVLAERIGDVLIPVLEKVLDKLEPFMDRLTGLDTGTITKWAKIIGVVAGIGPAFLGLSKAVGAMSTLISLASGIGPAGLALSALAGPIGIAAAAIVGIGAACVYFREELTPLWDVAKGFGDTIKSDFSEAFAGLGDNIHGTGGAAKQAVSDLAPLLAKFAEIHIAITTLPLRGMIKWLGTAANVFVRVATTVGKLFTALVATKDFIFAWLAQNAEELPFLGGLYKAFKGIAGVIKNVWDLIVKVAGALGSLPGKVLTKLTGGAITGLDSFTDYVKGQTAAIQFDVNPANSPTYQPLGQSLVGAAQQSKIYIDFSNLPEGAKVSQAGDAPVAMSANTGPLFTGAL